MNIVEKIYKYCNGQQSAVVAQVATFVLIQSFVIRKNTLLYNLTANQIIKSVTSLNIEKLHWYIDGREILP